MRCNGQPGCGSSYCVTCSPRQARAVMDNASMGTIQELRSQLATERARRVDAERERDELRVKFIDVSEKYQSAAFKYADVADQLHHWRTQAAEKERAAERLTVELQAARISAFKDALRIADEWSLDDLECDYSFVRIDEFKDAIERAIAKIDGLGAGKDVGNG